MLGRYWFKESADNFSDSYSPTSLTRTFTPSAISNKSWAAFGQATFSPEALDRRLHLTVGLHQSQDRHKATFSRATQVGNGPIIDVPGVGDGDRKFNNFSPSFVISYDVADDVNLYAKAVKAYKTGGYNIRASSIANFNQGFDSETLWSYEVGLKSQMLDNRLRLNVAGFIAKYSDIQINVQSDPTNIRITDVLNAGKATIKGVEADLTLAPTDNLRVAVNYGYIDPRYDEIMNVNGNDVSYLYRFTQTPKHTIAVDLTQEFPNLPFGNLSTNVNYSMQSKKFSNSTISAGEYIIGDYGLLNAQLTLAEIPGLDGVRLSVWGRNITDTEYYVMQLNAGLAGAMFGEPRTYDGIDPSFEY